MKRPYRIIQIQLMFLCLTSFIKAEPYFPVPQAEKEFNELIPYVKEYCYHRIKGDEKVFTFSTFPFAPMYLQVTKAKSPEEASTLKNYYYGIVGAASGIDSSELANAFHGGPPLAQMRKEMLMERLDKIKELHRDFSKYTQIQIIAQWFVKGEYRINNVFHMMDQTNEAIPSEKMGFIPSSKWKEWESVDKYISSIKLNKKRVENLINKMKEANIVACARSMKHGIRVIFIGMADNECGLLFLQENHKKPKLGDKLPDGRKYVGLEEIEPGIYFYTTT